MDGQGTGGGTGGEEGVKGGRDRGTGGDKAEGSDGGIGGGHGAYLAPVSLAVIDLGHHLCLLLVVAELLPCPDHLSLIILALWAVPLFLLWYSLKRRVEAAQVVRHVTLITEELLPGVVLPTTDIAATEATAARGHVLTVSALGLGAFGLSLLLWYDRQTDRQLLPLASWCDSNQLLQDRQTHRHTHQHGPQ